MNSEDVRGCLLAARDLIVRGWSQREWAKNRDGRPVNVFSPHACAWCPHGAIFRAGHDIEKADKRIPPQINGSRLAWRAIAFVQMQYGLELTSWADHRWRTKDEVIGLLERAAREVVA